jgi:DNA-binding transcriptional regulator YdaS (Cro superfamily)
VTSMPKVLVLLLVVQTSKAMAMHSRVQPPRLSQWGWARVTTPMVGVGAGARIHGGGPMPLAHGGWVSQLTSKGYF